MSGHLLLDDDESYLHRAEVFFLSLYVLSILFIMIIMFTYYLKSCIRNTCGTHS